MTLVSAHISEGCELQSHLGPKLCGLVQIYNPLRFGRGLQHDICALPSPVSCKWNNIIPPSQYAFWTCTFLMYVLQYYNDIEAWMGSSIQFLKP